MTNEIRYSYYEHPEDKIDTIIVYDAETVVLIHEHEDYDIGIESVRIKGNISKALRMVQDALDIIYCEEGYEDLKPNDLTNYNTNSLIAWNNAMVDNGIIPDDREV